MEIWKKINDEYEISSKGNVRRIKGGEYKYLKLEKLLKGYLRVCIYDNGIRKRILVHRLVANAFIPNDNKAKTQIDHINCNAGDNRVENLRWVTPKENVQHSIELDRFISEKKKKAIKQRWKNMSQEKKEQNIERLKKINIGRTPWNKGKKGLQKHTEEWKKQASERMKKYNEKNMKKVLCVETNIIYNSLNEASRILNISQGNISMCLCGKRNIAGGYHWQYVS